MALETIAVPAVHDLPVGQGMTVPTVGQERVFAVVAIDAAEHAVSRAGTGKGIRRLAVADLALGRRDIPFWHNPQGLVGRVTQPTIRIPLRRQVRRVALQAGGNDLMLFMAAVAEELGMTAGEGVHLLSDFAMAGEAFLARRLEGIAQIG